jgi:hypothetical protein
MNGSSSLGGEASALQPAETNDFYAVGRGSGLTDVMRPATAAAPSGI